MLLFLISCLRGNLRGPTKNAPKMLGTIINRGTTLVTGPSSRLSIVFDSEVIFTFRLTSAVSAPASDRGLYCFCIRRLTNALQRISVRILRGATVLVTVSYEVFFIPDYCTFRMVKSQGLHMNGYGLNYLSLYFHYCLLIVFLSSDIFPFNSSDV